MVILWCWKWFIISKLCCWQSSIANHFDSELLRQNVNTYINNYKIFKWIILVVFIIAVLSYGSCISMNYEIYCFFSFITKFPKVIDCLIRPNSNMGQNEFIFWYVQGCFRFEKICKINFGNFDNWVLKPYYVIISIE